MVDVTADGHLQGAGQSFEDALNLMVLIGAFGLDVQVHAGGIAQTLEEVQEHLGGHLSDLLAVELRVPDEPRTATEVEGYLTQAVVHRQTVAVALNAALGAEGFQQTFAQGDGRVLDGVVLIDVEVSLGVYGQVHHAVLAYLLQHVVEESESRLNVGLSGAVEVDVHVDVRLLGRALTGCRALTGEEYLRNLVPRHAVLSENQGLTAEVLGQLAVGVAVANDVAVLQVVLLVVNILRQHSRSRFAHRRVVFREVAVDVLAVEGDALALECLQDEVMYGPEGVFGKRVGAKSVLVADHDELEVEVFADKPQVFEHAARELQFLKRVYLLVGRFLDKGSVAVDEKELFHVES